jgi:hypothetical protein
MKNRIFALLALFAIAAFPQSNYGDEKPAAAPNATLEKYTNAEKQYSIDYPSSWKKTDVPELDIVIFAPSRGDENHPKASLNVVSQNVGTSIPLDTFYNESIDNLKKALKDVNVEKTGTSSLNGTESKWVIYTHVMQNIKFRVLQYFVVSDQTVYLITFGSADTDFDSYKKEFEQIVSSFKIIKS